VTSCRKEKDETAPTVEFISPDAGLTFFLPDTLAVRAFISDDMAVESVRLSIINSDAIAVGPSFTNTYSEQDVNFNVAFVIEDLSLESGPYNLQLTASDGENETRAFLPLTLIEVPRILEGFIYSTESSSQTSIIYVLMDGETETVMINGIDSRAAISQQDDRLFLSTDEASLGAYIYPNGYQSPWSVMFEDGQVISDLGFDESRKEILVSIPSEGVHLFSRNGSVVGFIPIEPDEELIDLAWTDEEIWLSMRRDNGLNVLGTVFRDSGVRIEERLLSFQGDILQFRSENELALAIPQGDIRLLNTITGGITPIDIPGDEEIKEIRRFLNDLFILKGNVIYRMTSSLQVQILYSGSGLQTLQIDEVNGRLYFIENDILRVYNIFPWSELGSQNLMPNAQDLLLLYNR
jgi:hypothetical protein